MTDSQPAVNVSDAQLFTELLDQNGVDLAGLLKTVDFESVRNAYDAVKVGRTSNWVYSNENRAGFWSGETFVTGQNKDKKPLTVLEQLQLKLQFGEYVRKNWTPGNNAGDDLDDKVGKTKSVSVPYYSTSYGSGYGGAIPSGTTTDYVPVVEDIANGEFYIGNRSYTGYNVKDVQKNTEVLGKFDPNVAADNAEVAQRTMSNFAYSLNSVNDFIKGNQFGVTDRQQVLDALQETVQGLQSQGIRNLKVKDVAGAIQKYAVGKTGVQKAICDQLLQNCASFGPSDMSLGEYFNTANGQAHMQSLSFFLAMPGDRYKAIDGILRSESKTKGVSHALRTVAANDFVTGRGMIMSLNFDANGNGKLDPAEIETYKDSKFQFLVSGFDPKIATSVLQGNSAFWADTGEVVTLNPAVLTPLQKTLSNIYSIPFSFYSIVATKGDDKSVSLQHLNKLLSQDKYDSALSRYQVSQSDFDTLRAELSKEVGGPDKIPAFFDKLNQALDNSGVVDNGVVTQKDFMSLFMNTQLASGYSEAGNQVQKHQVAFFAPLEQFASESSFEKANPTAQRITALTAVQKAFNFKTFEGWQKFSQTLRDFEKTTPGKGVELAKQHLQDKGISAVMAIFLIGDNLDKAPLLQFCDYVGASNDKFLSVMKPVQNDMSRLPYAPGALDAFNGIFEPNKTPQQKLNGALLSLDLAKLLKPDGTIDANALKQLRQFLAGNKDTYFATSGQLKPGQLDQEPVLGKVVATDFEVLSQYKPQLMAFLDQYESADFRKALQDVLSADKGQIATRDLMQLGQVAGLYALNQDVFKQLPFSEASKKALHVTASQKPQTAVPAPAPSGVPNTVQTPQANAFSGSSPWSDNYAGSYVAPISTFSGHSFTGNYYASAPAFSSFSTNSYMMAYSTNNFQSFSSTSFYGGGFQAVYSANNFSSFSSSAFYGNYQPAYSAFSSGRFGY